MRRLLPVLLLATGLACSVFGPSPGAPTPTIPTATESPSETVGPTSTVPPATATEPPPEPTQEPVQSLPNASGAAWVQVVDGLSKPVGLESPGDERLFVIEQSGLIRILVEDRILEDPFLDIQDRVFDEANEQGLLGLALHPNYSENGLFFVNYTGRGGGSFITRFEVSEEDSNRADANSEKVLLRFDQPFRNHNGGSIAFGPEGYLYIGTGDGGSGGDPQGNGQRVDTLLGKILRLDVDLASPYAIPPDNPFASGGGRPEIWAYGLRNPWRFSFDSLTGDLYIGDVGQNAWEEISFLPAGSPGGANFGWNIREGAHAFAGDQTEGLTDPVAEYANGQLGCSVTGGVVVRDASLPEWEGVYLYGDYCSGRIWGLVRDAQGAWQNSPLFDTDSRITSFGVGPAGEVYLLDHGGRVHRLQRNE